MEEKRERVRIGGRKSTKRTWSLHITTRLFSSIAVGDSSLPSKWWSQSISSALGGTLVHLKACPCTPWTTREPPTITGLASSLSLIPRGIYIKATHCCMEIPPPLTMRDGSLADGGFPLGLRIQSATSNSVCCSCFMSDKSPKTRSWLHIALAHIHRQSCDWSLRNKALMKTNPSIVFTS